MKFEFSSRETEREIVSRLKNPFKVEVYDELTSTFSLADEMQPFSVVIALDQTLGRGRLDRSFYCEKGGIYMSICMPVANPPTVTTPAAGVGVCRAIKRVMDLNCRIKWVNDVKYRGKKVSGILTKLLTDGKMRTVTGIGINYCVDIPEPLKDIAVSLTDKFSFSEFASLAAATIDEFCDALRGGDFIDEYRRVCETIGKDIVYEGKTYRAAGINDNGELIAESYRDGKRIIKTGEISEINNQNR